MTDPLRLQNNSIFDVLVADHNKHRLLLEKIENNLKAVEVKDWVNEFSIDAKAHASAEEQALYSILMQNPDLTDLTRHSVAEHKALEDLMDELYDLEPFNEQWNQKFYELKKKYLHHITEEEKEVFPAAMTQLSLAEKNQMGKKFKSRKPIEKNTASLGEEE